MTSIPRQIWFGARLQHDLDDLMNRELLSLLGKLSEQRTSYCLATVIEVIGSSSAPLGSRAVFDANGKLLLGWVGGGCAQSMVVHAAMESLAERRSRIIEVDLTDEVFGAGMPCGGHMRVFVEPCHPNPVVWILGSGALVEYLCHLASDLEFDVIVIDRSAHTTNYPRATRIINDDDRYQQLLPGPTDLVVIATHHKGDHLALHQLMPSEVDYIGLVASRKRAGLILNRLRSEGITEEQLVRIRAPAGIMIESQTPREIAISVVAEMIKHIRRRTSHGHNP